MVSTSEMEQGSKAGRKIRVLIADDSPPVQKRLASLLNDIDNVEVVGQTRDTPESISFIQHEKPEVIILDLQMPGGSGLDVLRQSQQQKPAPKIIMLTNFAFPTYRRKCLEEGASFFFDKSTEFDKIPQAIHQLYPDL